MLIEPTAAKRLAWAEPAARFAVVAGVHLVASAVGTGQAFPWH